MSIPDYQTLMLPALRSLGDGQSHPPRDVIARLANQYNLTEEERAQMLPSGRIQLFNNRVHWAVTYLRHAGLADNPTRGVWQISDEGKRVLAESPARVDNVCLRRYSSFTEWRKESLPKSPLDAPVGNESVQTTLDASETPEEILERTWRAIRTQVASELLEQILTASPQFFERLVVQLLVAMGYGGTFARRHRSPALLATAASTASSMKTALASTLSMSRLNDGRPPSAVPKSRSLRVVWKASALAKASLSRRPALVRMRGNTCAGLTSALF